MSRGCFADAVVDVELRRCGGGYAAEGFGCLSCKGARGATARSGKGCTGETEGKGGEWRGEVDASGFCCGGGETARIGGCWEIGGEGVLPTPGDTPAPPPPAAPATFG